ncbi:kinesin motor domain-containing protein [Artemisia annua]|uniref:Kinesin motor domain-containing protein n=1 Tax=Artemisia annua TaxID=35608 RepID=A0A2U1LK84_ARTAN|nr:kinesin motor domain-containing protein [Artemisia annua]
MKVIKLEGEVTKLSRQKNLQQRIHHYTNIRENNALKSQNEELSRKLRRNDAILILPLTVLDKHHEEVLLGNLRKFQFRKLQIALFVQGSSYLVETLRPQDEYKALSNICIFLAFVGRFGVVVNFKNWRAVTMDEGQGADNGVSVKEYLVETLRPLYEDKALSDICIFFWLLQILLQKIQLRNLEEFQGISYYRLIELYDDTFNPKRRTPTIAMHHSGASKIYINDDMMPEFKMFRLSYKYKFGIDLHNYKIGLLSPPTSHLTHESIFKV